MKHLVEHENYEKGGDYVVLRCEETGELFLFSGKSIAAMLANRDRGEAFKSDEAKRLRVRSMMALLDEMDGDEK